MPPVSPESQLTWDQPALTLAHQPLVCVCLCVEDHQHHLFSVGLQREVKMRTLLSEISFRERWSGPGATKEQRKTQNFSKRANFTQPTRLKPALVNLLSGNNDWQVSCPDGFWPLSSLIYWSFGLKRRKAASANTNELDHLPNNSLEIAS